MTPTPGSAGEMTPEARADRVANKWFSLAPGCSLRDAIAEQIRAHAVAECKARDAEIATLTQQRDHWRRENSMAHDELECLRREPPTVAADPLAALRRAAEKAAFDYLVTEDLDDGPEHEDWASAKAALYAAERQAASAGEREAVVREALTTTHSEAAGMGLAFAGYLGKLYDAGYLRRPEGKP